MEKIKQMLVSVLRVVMIAAVILFTYIVVGSTVGTIIFIIGSILIVTVFFTALLGLVKGESRLLKTSGRFNLFMILTDTIVVSLILIITWSANTVLQEEMGPLSATDKIGFMHNAFASNENEISTFTQDYPVLETSHITFRYHPDTEKSVEGMVAVLESIEELEKDIYGHEIQKGEHLEVLVLKNTDDYFELNQDVHPLEGGHYNPNRKRAMVYEGGVSGMEGDLYVIEVFVHEYSHYLLDLYLEQENINRGDVPVWFDEGIAELMKNRVVPTTLLPGENEFSLSFLELHTHREWDSAKAQLDKDVYNQAYLAIEYILGNHGNLSVLSDLLQEQIETEDFNQAFDRMTGLELTNLHQSVSLVEQELNLAWHTWSVERDFHVAESLYKEMVENFPSHRRTWEHYAMMHEHNENWEAAVATRREHIKINPTAESLLNLSYMLILTDSKEAVTVAAEALEAARKDPYDHSDFFEQWMEDVSYYHQLLTDNKTLEAYDFIMESEHSPYLQELPEELSDNDIL